MRDMSLLLAEDRTGETNHRSPQEGWAEGDQERVQELNEATEGDAHQPRRPGKDGDRLSALFVTL